MTSNKAGYTDKSIFLPAAGYRSDASLDYVGSRGYYWSSSLNPVYSSSARFVLFGSGDVGRYDNGRYFGHSVRPVTE